MANVQIQKTVYQKEQFEKAIDTEFRTFVDPEPEQDTDSIAELFRLYDKLFFEIPLEGDINSHRYLLEKTLELINIETNDEEIQPLLDEISTLREQLLVANTQLLINEERTTTAGLSLADNPDSLSIEEIAEIRNITPEKIEEELRIFTDIE